MRYEKPIVMDLGAGARAAGQWPLGCFSGYTGDGLWNDCQYGTNGEGMGNRCTTGPSPGSAADPVCISGTNPSVSLCQSGINGSDFGDSCHSGPGDV